jgi:hypothetical protein
MTWTDPPVTVNDVFPNGVGTPRIARLADGTIGVAWTALQFFPYNSESWFATSIDGGESFGPSRRAHARDVNTDFGSVSLTAPGNTFHIGILKTTEDLLSYIPVSSSSDRGETWSDPVVVNDSHPLSWTMPGRITFNPVLDELAVVWCSQERIWFAHSRDHGVTWSPATRVSDEDAVWVGDPDLAVDSRGRYWVVWYDARDDWCDVYIDHSDDGVSWRKDRRVNDPYHIGKNQYDPHIAIDPNDTIHVRWAENEPWVLAVDLYYTHSMDGGATWLEPNPRVNDVNGSACPSGGISPAMVAGESGRAYLVWKDMRDPGMNIYFTRTEAITPAPIEVQFVEYDAAVSPGEPLNFLVTAHNLSCVTKRFDGWLDVMLPDSVPHPANPQRSGVRILAPGASLAMGKSIPVKPNAPLGTLELFVRVGSLGGGTPSVWSEDSVRFTVTP